MRRHLETTLRRVKFNTCGIGPKVTSTLGQCQGWVWGSGQVSHPETETEPPALTILTQVQLGQAPAVEGLLEDGAGVAVAHSVQVHGFVLHPVLQPQQERQQETRGRTEEAGRERERINCRWKQKRVDRTRCSPCVLIPGLLSSSTGDSSGSLGR